jgi:hypothetical protein
MVGGAKTSNPCRNDIENQSYRTFNPVDPHIVYRIGGSTSSLYDYFCFHPEGQLHFHH